MSAPNVEAHVEKAQKALAAGQRVLVRGPVGSGRRTLAVTLAERVDQAVMVELSDADEPDAVPAAALALIAGVDDGPTRGRLIDEMREPAAATRQALDILSTSGKTLILLIPGSWRTVGSPEREGAPSSDRSAAVFRSIASATGRLVYITDTSRSVSDLNATDEQVIELEQGEVEFSTIFEPWGTYMPFADALAAAVGQHTRSTPAVWRLAVGAVAMGTSSARVAAMCARPAPEATRGLSAVIARGAVRRGIGAALSRLVLARRPVAQSTIAEMTHLADDQLPLLTQCLGYGDPLRVPMLVRRTLQTVLSTEGVVGADSYHAAWAELHKRCDGVANPRQSVSSSQMSAWIERVHHLGHAGRAADDAWNQLELPAPEFYWDRGRALSDQGEFDRAAAVYAQCMEAFPDDDYSRHYYAFNREKIGDRSPAVRSAYLAAAELRPGHAWWHGRLVNFLIRAQDFKAARTRWRTALLAVDPDGVEVARDTRLAEDLHFWVSEAWLAAGHWREARRIVDSIPEEIRRRATARDFAGLGRRIDDAREAEYLSFTQWLSKQIGPLWESAREWWAQAYSRSPDLPAPAAYDSPEGGAKFAWSLADLYVDLEFLPDGGWAWFGAERAAAPGEGEGAEGCGPVGDERFERWLERASCA